MKRMSTARRIENLALLAKAQAELYRHHDQDELDATARALGRPDLIPDRQEDLPLELDRAAA